MSDNPFASPAEAANPYAPNLASSLPLGIEIQGDCLVAPSGIRLPARCVRTNEPTTPGDERRKTYYFAPSWVFVLILVNIVVLAIVYFLIRKPCEIAFSESPTSRRKRHTRVFVCSLVSAALFFGIILAAAFDSVGPIVLTVILFFISLIVLALMTQGPLKIVRNENGRFWIKGFSPEYLNDLANGVA